MININNNVKNVNMPESCGMKGMHESHGNHARRPEIIEKQANSEVEVAKDEKLGNKLDVRV